MALRTTCVTGRANPRRVNSNPSVRSPSVLSGTTARRRPDPRRQPWFRFHTVSIASLYAPQIYRLRGGAKPCSNGSSSCSCTYMSPRLASRGRGKTGARMGGRLPQDPVGRLSQVDRREHAGAKDSENDEKFEGGASTTHHGSRGIRPRGISRIERRAAGVLAGAIQG